MPRAGNVVELLPPFPTDDKTAVKDRTAGLGTDAVSVIVDRWASRLSAILIRGNGAAVRAHGLSPCEPPLAYEGGPGLACCIPEGDCAYELLVS